MNDLIGIVIMFKFHLKIFCIAVNDYNGISKLGIAWSVSYNPVTWCSIFPNFVYVFSRCVLVMLV